MELNSFFKMADIFMFQLPRKIVFGNNAIEQIGEEAATLFGSRKRVLLVTDKGIIKAGLARQAIRSLKEKGFDVLIFDEIVPDPPISVVLKGSAIARKERVDIIFAMGGGSSIDAAKAISVMATHDGDIHDLLGEYKVTKPGLPKIFTPTTAGTGAEISNTFVLVDDIDGKGKVSSQSAYTYADLSIIDPMLTLNLPPQITAETGIDAFSHCLEAFVGVRANPLSDMMSSRAIELISGNLRKAYANGSRDIEARYAMCLGVCLASMSCRSSGVGNIHSTCYPLSQKYNLSHGLAVALMMPAVMEYNLISNPDKFAAVAKAMDVRVDGMNQMEAARSAVTVVKELIADIGLPGRLRDINVSKEDFAGFAGPVVHNFPRISSNNPRQCNEKDIMAIYNAAY